MEILIILLRRNIYDAVWCFVLKNQRFNDFTAVAWLIYELLYSFKIAIQMAFHISALKSFRSTIIYKQDSASIQCNAYGQRLKY